MAPCQTGSKFISPTKYSEVSPSTVYEITSPFFTSLDEERHHGQISDKAFEDKSRLALIRYVDECQYSLHELNRVIEMGGKLLQNGRGCLSWRLARFGSWNANIVSRPYSITLTSI